MPSKNFTNVDDYFRQFTSQIGFLSAKEGVETVRGVSLEGMHLPIPVATLVEQIQRQQDWEHFNLEPVVHGMLLMIAADPEFKEVDAYKTALYKWLSPHSPAQKAFSLGLEKAEAYGKRVEVWAKKQGKSSTVPATFGLHAPSMEEWRVDQQAMLFLRAAFLLAPHSVLFRWQYARWLWRLATKDVQELFVREASRLLEEGLSEEEQQRAKVWSIEEVAHSRLRSENQDIAPLYYELGSLNFALGHALKAQRYYEKALERPLPAALRMQIAEEYAKVQESATIETMIRDLQRADAKRVLESADQYPESQRYDLWYYRGLAHRLEKQWEDALEAFLKAKALGADFGDFYNDYAVTLEDAQRRAEALAILQEGLEAHPAHLRMRYNRAALYAEAGQKTRALEDVDFILEYADLSDEFRSQCMTLKEALL